MSDIIRYASSFALSLLFFCLDKWADAVWADWPWGWISLCALAFLFGQLVSDILNPGSRIRQFFARRLQVFTVESVWAKYEGDSLALTAKLRAKRKVRGSDIQLVVYRRLIHGHLSHDFTESLEKDATFSRGEEKDYRLATIPLAHHLTGQWHGGRDILHLGQYMIHIRSSTWRSRDRHRIYVELLATDNNTCGRFFFFDEARDPMVLKELIESGR